jgi:GAF domain-containing protein
VATIEDPVARSIASLALYFIGDGTLRSTLTDVTHLTCEALAADMAGITMLVDGRPATGVFTEESAAEIDTWQYESAGRGPCIDAFHRQEVFRITDTSTDDRWPQFAAGALSHGVRSTLSLPLTRTGTPLGAVNVYSYTPGHFPEDTTAAEMLAIQAGIVLANAHAYQESCDLNENLNQALTSRRTIDYAIGLLMSVGGRSPEEAFQVLVRASQRENRKLRDIAADLVDSAATRRPVLQPDPD